MDTVVGAESAWHGQVIETLRVNLVECGLPITSGFIDVRSFAQCVHVLPVLPKLSQDDVGKR